MLIKEKLETYPFSNAERIVAQFILDFPEKIETFSIHHIAKETFTQPSTLIRLAKKLDFSGWKAFKKAFLEEWQYLNRHFINIDANKPFQQDDNIMTIVQKLVALQQSTLEDLQSLLHHDQLSQAKQLLLQSSEIFLFAQNANLLVSQDFALKMNRIGKRTTLSSLRGEENYDCFRIPPTGCAILISYSGENTNLLNIAKLLHKRHIPTLAITSIGDNTLASSCTYTLPIVTREKLYSKIGSFTVNLSISFLLNVLYALVFSKNYEQNFDHLVMLGQAIDTRKFSSEIMKEDE